MKELQKFNLSHNIVKGILDIVQASNTSYMDACISYAETNNMEIEVVAEYVKKSDLIKGLIQEEAEKLNFIKKTRRVEHE